MDKKIYKIYNILFEKYGYQNWWPIVEKGESHYLEEYRTRERTAGEILEIMIGAILTQNTSWLNAEKSLNAMKERGILDLDVLRDIDESGLSQIIKGSGYYNQKTKKIKALSLFLYESLSGDVLRLRESDSADARKMLLSVWGIGRETADSILLYGYYYPVFVIDGYTRRIFKRLGIKYADAGYDDLQAYIEYAFKPDRIKYQEYHAGLVMFGKNFCRKNPACEGCFISFMCRFAESRTGYAQKRT